MIGKTHMIATILNSLFMIGVVYIVIKLMIKEMARPHYIESEVIDKQTGVRGYSGARGLTSYSPVNIVIVSSDGSKQVEYTIKETLYDNVDVGSRYKFLIKGREIKEII